MKFETVKNVVANVPYISVHNAKILYDFIIKNNLTDILELGIAHGTASCYIAAALDELKAGKLTSVDLLEAKNLFSPSIEEQLSKLQLNNYVEIHRMQTGYNWYLHEKIKLHSNRENNVCTPQYDLIIIDGPKNWTIDSSSFFLADKLLKERGWIIWDDYEWTYNKANSIRESTDGITHRNLSEEERQIPHIKEIFHLLVMQHPSYGNFIIHSDGDWAWAQKIQQDTKSIKYTTSKSISSIVIGALKRLKK